METVISLMLREDDASPLRMADVAKAAGVTRQTVYHHFANRTEMLIAAILHFGEQMDVEARLAPSRNAATGRAHLQAFNEGILAFYPVISPVRRSLMRLGAGDQDAVAAWDNRLIAMKEGCAAAVAALARDGDLTEAFTEERATDAYFAMLSMDAWAHCVLECGWSETDYLAHVQRMTASVLLRAG